MDWYYIDSGQQTGPISDEEMQELVKTGKITSDTMIWHKGLSDWQKFGTFKREKNEVIATSPANKWYYVDDAGLQTGPIPDEELRALVRQGKITSDTSVWHSGLSDWQKFGTQEKGTSELSAGLSLVKGGDEEAICSECRRAFPQGEMLRYEESWICPDCKPLFVQKLKEGAPVAGRMEYAGFWIRFGAKFVDYIILFVFNSLLTLLAGMVMPMGESIPSVIGFQMVLFLIQIAIGVGYTTWFVGKYGATPGKMVCKLKIVTAEGGSVSYARACGRYFAEIISSMILLLGYIMAAFDEEKRALHDRICDTRVIRA